MVKKVVLGILLSALILFITVIVIVLCYLNLDIETNEPEKEKQICEIKTEQYKNRKVFIVTPKEEKSNIKILYFHGGAYAAEATEKHWEFIQKLALDTKATIIMPDYPLIPKYNYKDVFEMVEPLYREIIEEVDSENLIVMGDSAGGGLGLALMEKVSLEDMEIAKKLILISPWLDVRLTNPEIENVQNKDEELDRKNLKLAGIAYAGEDGINSYLVNPIDGDLSKLNNITIFAGTNDILNPDAHLMQEKAKKQGVSIELIEYESAAHNWIIENNSSEELIKKGYEDLLESISK